MYVSLKNFTKMFKFFQILRYQLTTFLRITKPCLPTVKYNVLFYIKAKKIRCKTSVKQNIILDCWKARFRDYVDLRTTTNCHFCFKKFNQ